MKSLFEVIVLVRKKDKKLVDWHYRSDGVKTAIRLVGLDRRTHVVIEKNTKKLQDKVQKVEKKFDKTGHVFDGGLQEAARLKSGFLEFSTGNVERVSQDVSSTRDAYDQEYERVDALVRQQNAQHEDAQTKEKELSQTLGEAKQSHDNAEWSMTAWSTVSITSMSKDCTDHGSEYLCRSRRRCNFRLCLSAFSLDYRAFTSGKCSSWSHCIVS